ncbi:hypothetical protein ACHAQA_007844 [Verticillium albo-atrum]
MAEPSTNPFRRKSAAAAASDRPSIPKATSSAAFLQSITTSTDSDGTATPPLKQKVVKRVRVQSPPPSPSVMPNPPVIPGYTDDRDDHDDRDPFESRFPANPDNMGALPEAAPLVAANRGSETSFEDKSDQDMAHDLEAATTASAPGKGALDVNAFQRLLLTGQSGPEAIVAPAVSLQSNDDTPSLASSETPHETNHDEVRPTPPTSHRGTPVPPGPRKPPPPPSSRHGKSIRPQFLEEVSVARPSSSSSSLSSPKPRSPSDVNKPLPPAPRVRGTDEAEDIFAREAAGKVPEHDEVLASPGPAPTSGKKPTPAPPPRRGHARAESKQLSASHAMPVHDDEAQPRSSVDSQRSRSESIRTRDVPAPPPPRRPATITRTSASFPSLASPTSPFSDVESSPFEATQTLDARTSEQAPKISPPPPPPARKASTRRPQPKDPEAASRRVEGREKENNIAPPPPPPRQRGSSKGSMDGPAVSQRTSLDSVRVFTPPAHDHTNKGAIVEESGEGLPGESLNILADLDALQREVDALRGQYRGD